MYSIGRVPAILRSFFSPIRDDFSKPAFRHFSGLVLAFALGTVHTIGRLNGLLRGHTHRTKDGEFLWKSHWDESWVLQQIALDTLRRLHRKGEPIYLILDDTQTLKRAKKMQGVGTLFHHAEKRYVTGHTILKACLVYRGVTIPWASVLYVKKQHAAGLGVPFKKLTELAADIIGEAPLGDGADVIVLFDSFYLCSTVVDAVVFRKWRYIGVGKGNRRFIVGGQGHRLDAYGRNVLRRSGKWQTVVGLRKSRTCRVAERIGLLKGLGEVRVVFSRRKEDHEGFALVTNDRSRAARKVVADYLLRWSIELLIKDEKQHLGLGDYRVLRYRAVVRHLHLVDIAYACLTHVGLRAARAKGETKTKNACLLRLPPIRQLKTELERIIWRETVNDVVRVSHDKRVIRRLERLMAA